MELRLLCVISLRISASNSAFPYDDVDLTVAISERSPVNPCVTGNPVLGMG